MGQSRGKDSEVIELFKTFYKRHYRAEITRLAEQYPSGSRSLYIDAEDLEQFNPDLKDDFLARFTQMQEYAEKALRSITMVDDNDEPLHDHSFDQVTVRAENLPKAVSIGHIQARHREQLVAVSGIVQRVTEVADAITEAAFQCQRCMTLTRIPQTPGRQRFEPHECQGCERKGPFEINTDQSKYIRFQSATLQESPSEAGGGALETVEVTISGDPAGAVAAGESVRINGVVRLDDEADDDTPDTIVDVFLEAVSVRPVGDSSPRPAASIGPDDLRPVESLADYTDAAVVALSGLSTVENVTEEETKAKLITPFVEALGWNKYDSNEVRLEYTDEATDMLVDYALFEPDMATPTALVEAKRLGKSLTDSEIVAQLTTYLRLFDADYGLLTNGESLRVYDNPNDGLPRHIADLSVSDVEETDILEPFQHPRRRSE